jgi:hypothetical protein
MAASASPFSARLIAAVVLGAAIAFLGFLFLTAYAPQLRLKGGEGASPLSRSAVGFYGLYRLAETTGRPVDAHADRAAWGTDGLLIATIRPDTDPALIREFAAARRNAEDSVTLYVLPKWQTMPSFTTRGWVQQVGRVEPYTMRAQLAAIDPALRLGVAQAAPGSRVTGRPGDWMGDVDVAQPRETAFIANSARAVLRDSNGRTILGALAVNGDGQAYVLADPDLLSNMAMKTPEGARAALQIVDALRYGPEDSVAFDLVLPGGGANTRNLLQLMFEPPFLALTIAVLAAALLAGVRAFGRFGPPVPEPRAIPFGKRALADNAAMLIGRANAVRRMGDRYVAIVRDAVAGALGAGAMTADEQERWLARLPAASGDFATLAALARGATTSEGVRAAAARLHQWRNEVTRER